MTKLTTGKSAIRETQVFDHGRAILAALHPAHLALRLKGTRKEWILPYDTLLWFACRREVEQTHRERALARKREAALRRGS